jgi:hypothetical protein
VHKEKAEIEREGKKEFRFQTVNENSFELLGNAQD